MKKVLYGVQGTGNGHISRARIMAERLSERNIDVDYLFSGRAQDQYFDMDVFGDCQYRRGLTFATKSGRVQYLATGLNNSLWRFIQEARNLRVDDYDLIITDFEPVTAWAGKLNKKLVIGIGHQYAFEHNIPIVGDSVASRFIMKHFAPANINIGLHWHSFGNPILPPIIDHHLQQQSSTAAKPSILVYLPFEDQQYVTTLLQHFDSYRFVQYAPSLQDQNAGNVQLRKTCHDGFKSDLMKTSGVICNAGFELISECLHMGIPVLAKPLDKQMEQLSNAAALEKLGYASTMPTLSVTKISHWLSQHHTHKIRRFPDVAKAIVQWLCLGQTQSIDELSSILWQQCSSQNA